MTPLQLVWEWPGTAVTVLIVIVVSLVVRWILVLAIRRWVKTMAEHPADRNQSLANRASDVLERAAGPDTSRRGQRVRTTGSLLTNAVNVLTVTIMLLTILGIVGVPMGPLLASAGIGGLALGFGAQSLVKDVISGLFLVAEDQYGVGDVIQVGDLEGTVEDVGLRVTRIRHWAGTVWYVRNGEITKLGNQTQGWSTAVIEIPTHYSEDPEEVIAILHRTVTQFDADPQWHNQLLEPPAVWGLDAIGEQTMVFKLAIKTPSNKQFGPQRALRSRAMIALKQAGVRGPTQIVETREVPGSTLEAEQPPQ